MKLSDIIESPRTSNYQRLVWAVIQEEFDSLLKPLGGITNEKLLAEWTACKCDAWDWIGNTKNDFEMGSGGINYGWACEFVGVNPATLWALYEWARENKYPYFPASVDFKKFKFVSTPAGEAVELELDESVEPTIEADKELPDDLTPPDEEEEPIEFVALFTTDGYESEFDEIVHKMIHDDYFYMRQAIETKASTAAVDS